VIAPPTESGNTSEADRICTVDNENPRFFSVYARLKPQGDSRGLACLGDFESHALAQGYAYELAQQHGWPVHDYVPGQFRQQ
jgi:hypothetical protein